MIFSGTRARGLTAIVLGGAMGMAGCGAMYSGAAVYQSDPRRAAAFSAIGSSITQLEAAYIKSENEKEDHTPAITSEQISQILPRNESGQRYFEEKYMPRIRELDEIEKTRSLTRDEAGLKKLLLHKIDPSVSCLEVPKGSHLEQRLRIKLEELRELEKSRPLTQEESTKREYIGLLLDR